MTGKKHVAIKPIQNPFMSYYSINRWLAIIPRKHAHARARTDARAKCWGMSYLSHVSHTAPPCPAVVTQSLFLNNTGPVTSSGNSPNSAQDWSPTFPSPVKTEPRAAALMTGTSAGLVWLQQIAPEPRRKRHDLKVCGAQQPSQPAFQGLTWKRAILAACHLSCF